MLNVIGILILFFRLLDLVLMPKVVFQASGSGDTTVRFWDLTTETPQFECKGHRQYVLALAWAPDGTKVLYFEVTILSYSVEPFKIGIQREVGLESKASNAWIVCVHIY